MQFADYFARRGSGPTSFLPSYGLAEHSLAVSFARGGLDVDASSMPSCSCRNRVRCRSSMARRHCASSAVAGLPGHAIRIVDEAFNELPERHVGSI
jgi:fatty-acyl-CoA synthase